MNLTRFMDSLMLSNILNYQAEIIQSILLSFESFLIQKKVSGITRKNYKSDLKTFLTWVVKKIQMDKIPPTLQERLQAFARSINIEHVQEWTAQLQKDGTPATTINRRLSAIRLFFQIAFESGLRNENFASQIQNIQSKSQELSEDVIEGYEQFLTHEHASKATIKIYVNDVLDFFTWMKNEQQQT